MKRLTAVILAGAMSLASFQALAQGGGTSGSAQNPDGLSAQQPVDAPGLDAFGQAPPGQGGGLFGGSFNPFLIGGLTLGAIGGIIGLAVSQNNNNNPVSP